MRRLPTLGHPLLRVARARMTFWVIAALLLAQVGGLLASSHAAVAAPSVNPGDEIIYIDPGGVIRVLDPNTPAGQPQVQWFSPTGNWRHIALGDVNNDGDMEIIALGQEGGILKVAVFDPVVASGSYDPSRLPINGIPWDILYETQFPAAPLFIGAGNFDPGIQGDEIVLGYADAFGRRYVQIWNADGLGPNGNPTGRTWKVHINKEYTTRYTDVAVGDLLANGIDEIVLIARDSQNSRFDVMLPNQDMLVLASQTTDSGDFRSVAIGQIIPGGKREIALGRTGRSPSSHSLFIFELDNNNSLRATLDNRFVFFPNPQHVFLADISGNGDDEVFFIRFPSVADSPRLIMRDQWGDDRSRHPTIELRLDADNGYTVGAGGDLDGDGKDEIIIMRNNNIRIYTRPDNNVNRSEDILNIAVNTDSKNLLTGNLDRNGFVIGPSFTVDRAKLEIDVPTGTMGGPLSFAVNTTAEQIFFSVTPGANWILPSVTNAATPATINVQFNATNLPRGTYRANIVLSTNQDVVNKPFIIEVEMNVLGADLRPLSGGVGFSHYPCADPLAPLTQTLDIRGTNDLRYRAMVISVPDEAAAAGSTIVGGEIDAGGNIVLHEASGRTRTVAGGEISASATLTETWPIDPAVPWLTEVTSDRASVPSTITLVADPTVLGPGFEPERAMLIMVADTRAGSPPENIRAVPITLMCATSRVALPSVVR